MKNLYFGSNFYPLKFTVYIYWLRFKIDIIYLFISKNAKTNVAQRFLRIVVKDFPKTSRLHKIFNRNSGKVSYSCMPNVKSIISNYNRRIFTSNTTSLYQKTCNCRIKHECQLLGKCLTKSLVYKAEITTTDIHESKNYVGCTAGPFKKRFDNHKKSLNNPVYAKCVKQVITGTLSGTIIFDKLVT